MCEGEPFLSLGMFTMMNSILITPSRKTCQMVFVFPALLLDTLMAQGYPEAEKFLMENSL